MIVEFKHNALITSNKPCFVHVDFIPTMELLCTHAKNNGVKLVHISSYRKTSNVKGAIVVPAKKSNHMVGFAIDCNIIDAKGVYWNSIKMREGLGGSVLNFITDATRDKKIRWGGNFRTKDEVHFDNGLNIRNPKKWEQVYLEINK